MEELYELASKYADSIIEGNEFKRLKELQLEIKKTLSSRIMAFKTAEAKYLEAKDYGKFHPNLKEYQEVFIQKKKSLYNEPLIIEYKKLERQIQSKLDCDLDDLKKGISNKFQLSKSIFLD